MRCCVGILLLPIPQTLHVGRDSYLDARLSILENRPTAELLRGVPLQISTRIRFAYLHFSLILNRCKKETKLRASTGSPHTRSLYARRFYRGFPAHPPLLAVVDCVRPALIGGVGCCYLWKADTRRTRMGWVLLLGAICACGMFRLKVVLTPPIPSRPL